MADDDRFASARFEDRVDAPLWKAYEDGEFRIQRCTGCQRWTFPAEWRCGRCGSYEFSWELADPIGTVYSWIRTHYAYSQAAAPLIPYVNVLVELPGADNCRIVGLLVGESSGIKVGSSVEGFIGSEIPGVSRPVMCWRLAHR